MDEKIETNDMIACFICIQKIYFKKEDTIRRTYNANSTENPTFDVQNFET